MFCIIALIKESLTVFMTPYPATLFPGLNLLTIYYPLIPVIQWEKTFPRVGHTEPQGKK